MKNVKNIVCALLTVVLLSSIILLFSVQPVASKTETIVLKSVTFLPKDDRNVVPFLEFMKRVNERSKGELKIEWTGGPEAIGMFDQASALQKGVLDIVYTGCSFYANIVPCCKASGVTMVDPVTERKKGMVDLFQKAHKEAGFYYLGRLNSPRGFFVIGTNKRVENPRTDFKGVRIRTSPIYDEMLKSLGASRITMSMMEVYTAMERGTVDGFVYPITSIVGQSLHEVTKYMIDHPFGMGFTTPLINLDRWNRLPKHLKDLMTEVMIEVEPWQDEYNKRAIVEDRKAVQEAGVEFIRFSSEDAKWFLGLWGKARWGELKRICPKYYPKVKELFYHK